MSWQDQLKGDSLSWLLESDSPGTRYLALRDLVDDADEAEIDAARETTHREGPIRTILENMSAEGFWAKEGPGYNPKYRSTVWALIMLAQLGASAKMDERIALACSYFLDHALADGGQISMSGSPSGTADCLQGNMCWALTALGYDDPRLNPAYEWMARTVTGEGLAPNTDQKAPLRYYAGKCGPVFACGSNNKLPCAWGGAKVMLAFGVLPKERRTPLIEEAIQQGVDFLLSVDPAEATYPNGFSDKPSGNWWKFGFPVFYITDLLQVVEALVGLDYADDPRLENALTLIRKKQDANGRWPLEYSYTGKTWVDYGLKKKPNKWVTLRTLRVLKATI
ncbi:MAG: hypothetical protein PVJ21_18000 [Anaerolineales bacterium]|jgi:hypothetical protein